jgi:hypothetical protein
MGQTLPDDTISRALRFRLNKTLSKDSFITDSIDTRVKPEQIQPLLSQCAQVTSGILFGVNPN